MNVRKWFQLRLSTMIVLTIVAGLLMALNFRPYDYADGTLRTYGWPFSMIYCLRLAFSGIRFNDDVVNLGNSNYLVLRYCVANLAVFAATLIWIAFVLEWFARRKN